MKSKRGQLLRGHRAWACGYPREGFCILSAQQVTRLLFCLYSVGLNNCKRPVSSYCNQSAKDADVIQLVENFELEVITSFLSKFGKMYRKKPS